MRKLLVLLLVITACTPNPSRDIAWFQESGKVRVLTTIAMIHNLVEEVGGEHVIAIPLIRGELDPHSYELVKGDDEKFHEADLIFYNGLGLEHGLSLRQNLEGNPKAIAVTTPLLECAPEAILRIDGQYDPHVWMDITLWIRAIDPIVEALCKQDPLHADIYRGRGKILAEKMRRADEEAYSRLQAIASEKRFLVTSHDAFNYFTRRYLADPGEEEWQHRCRAPEGLAPEAQMSVRDVIALIDHVKQFGIKVLFSESNVNRDALKKILSAATEKGLSIHLSRYSLYGDAMGGATSYLEMIGHNVDVIVEELSR